MLQAGRWGSVQSWLGLLCCFLLLENTASLPCGWQSEYLIYSVPSSDSLCPHAVSTCPFCSRGPAVRAAWQSWCWSSPSQQKVFGAGRVSSLAASWAPHLYSHLAAVTLDVYHVIADINFRKTKVGVMNVLFLLVELVLLVLKALLSIRKLGYRLIPLCVREWCGRCHLSQAWVGWFTDRVTPDIKPFRSLSPIPVPLGEVISLVVQKN